MKHCALAPAQKHFDFLVLHMFNVLKSKPIHVCFFGDADQKHVTALSSPLCSKCLPFMDIRLNPKRKNTFLRPGSHVGGKHEAGSTYPGHLSVIGALLLWHDAGCQLQTPFKRVSMCEIERREWKAVVKQTEAPASKVQQPPATSHSNFHSQRDWCWEYTLSSSDRWLSWMPDRSLGLCDAA